MNFKSKLEFEKYLKGLRNIGFGSEGKCYQLDDNTVLKYLNGPCYIVRTKEELLKFSNININNFVFIKQVIEINDEIVACLMPFINGKNLYKQNLFDTYYSTIVSAVGRLYDAIVKVTSKHIMVYDTDISNIIFYESDFYIVDTMNFSISNIEIEKLQMTNLKRVFSNLYLSIFSIYIRYFLNSSKQFANYEKECYWYMKPTKFLNDVYQYISEYCGYQVKTMSEADKIIVKNNKFLYI